MRKIGLLLMVIATSLLLASGIAYAKSIVGNSKDNILTGTNQNDTIAGGGGDDGINGKAGNDRLYGDSGADDVSGGVGNDDVFGGKGADDLFGRGGDDYINSADNRGGDFADCGPGIDSAVIDAVNFEKFSAGVGSLVVVGANDTIVNCEDVTTVLTNPGSGTDSEDLANIQRNEVDAAVEAGILEEVK